MKKTVAFLCVIALLINLCGCTKADTQGGFSFTDDLGRTVEVSDITRVAALLGSYADMWILAGGTVCAAADDAWEDFNLEPDNGAVNLGSTHRPDTELLLSAQPDFVIASSKLAKHLDLQAVLDSVGIAVAYFDVSDFDSYLRVLKIMTQLTGKSENYEKYGTAQQERINEIISSAYGQPVQTVLVMRASASSIRAKNSESTMLGGMLTDFGCVNIADSDAMLLENLSIESIVRQNPDKLFFIQTGDELDEVKKNVEQMFSENPLWYSLDAVKNGEVYYMDKRLYNLKPNAKFAQAYENLEKILYD